MWQEGSSSCWWGFFFLGILNLVNVPLGTLIGVYTLWILLDDEATAYFDTLEPV